MQHTQSPETSGQKQHPLPGIIGLDYNAVEVFHVVTINVAGVKTTPKISSTPLLVASQLLPGVTAKPSYCILAITPPSDGS